MAQTTQRLWRPWAQGVGSRAISWAELLGLAEDKESMMKKHHIVRDSVLT